MKALAENNQTPALAGISIPDLTKLCQSFGIDAAAKPEKLCADAVSDLGQSLYLVVRAGLGLLALKSQVGHGGFEKALSELNVSSQRASEATRIATTYAQLPADQQRKLIAAPKTTAILLASLSTDELAEAHEQGELDDWIALPRTALKRELDKYREQRDDARLKVEDLTNELKLERKKGAQTHSGAPEWLRPAKLDAVVLTEGMSECLDGLERMGAELVLNGGDAVSQRQLAGTLYYSLAQLYARTHALLTSITEEHGEAIAGAEATFEFAIAPDQIEELAARRREVIGAVQLRRETVRRDALPPAPKTPGKRGRPAGSKNKK